MLPYILAGAGLLQGLSDAKEAKKAKQAEAKRDAEMIRWSPWSGISPEGFAKQSYVTPSATSAGLAGAASMGMTGLNIQNAMAEQRYKDAIAAHYSKLDESELPEEIRRKDYSVTPGRFSIMDKKLNFGEA